MGSSRRFSVGVIPGMVIELREALKVGIFLGCVGLAGSILAGLLSPTNNTDG